MFSLFCAAAGVYAVAADSSSAGSSTTTGETETNKWSGSYSYKNKGDIILSEMDKDDTRKNGLNIKSDSDVNDLVSSTVARDSKDGEKIAGSVEVKNNVDLTLKAVSEEGNATAFQAKSVSLRATPGDDGNDRFLTSKGAIDKEKLDITKLETADFKIVAEAVAEKGKATGVKIEKLNGLTSRVYGVDDKDKEKGEEEDLFDLRSENGGNVDITANVKGQSATGIEIGELEGADVKLDAQAVATKGEAIAVKSNYITGGKDKDGVYENGVSIKAAADATGGDATAISVDSYIDGKKTLAIDASAISRVSMTEDENGVKSFTDPKNAVAVKVGNIKTQTGEIKAVAVSEGGAATGLETGYIADKTETGNLDIKIDASAQAKVAQSSESVDADKNITKEFKSGDATAVSLSKIGYEASATIKAAALAEGRNATALTSNGIISARNVSIDAQAVANIADSKIVTDKDGKETTHEFASGNAIAIKATQLEASDGTKDTEKGKDSKFYAKEAKKLEPLSFNVNASAVAQKDNATGIDSNVLVGYSETKTIDVVKTLPEKLTNDVSATINASASAGTVGENGDNKIGNATAFKGDITVGSEITVDNYTTVEVAKGATKTDIKKVAPISFDDLVKADRLGKAALNGSFTANAVGGDAIAVKADNIEIGNRVILKQADYQTKQAEDSKLAGDLKSAFADGKLVQKYEKDADGKWSPKFLDKDGKETFEDTGVIAPVTDVVADSKTGEYKMGDKAAPDVNNETLLLNDPKQFARFSHTIGDFNATVSATALGGNATGIEATDKIIANINGDVSAVANANVKNKLDNEGKVTKETESIEFGSATAINAGSIYGNINGNVSAVSEGGNATGIKADAIYGEINGKVEAISKAVLAYDKDGKIRVDADGKLDDATKTGNAVAIDPKTKYTKFNGTVIAKSQGGTATGIETTDGIVSFGNGAIVDAKEEKWNAENQKFEHINTKWSDTEKAVSKEAYNGMAIDAGTETLDVTVDGRADIKGNVKGKTMTVNSGNLVVAGDFNVGSIYIKDGAILSQSADAAGNLGKYNLAKDGKIGYEKLDNIDKMTNLTGAQKAEMKNAYAASMRASKLSGNATMLVNDVKSLGVTTDLIQDYDDAFRNYKENGSSEGVDIKKLGALDGNDVNFSFLVDADTDNVSVKVNRLSYFQNKASNANSARLGAALDGITTIEASENETKDEALAREAAIQTRRDFKSDVETLGMAASGSNTSINLDGFLPTAQSFIAQLNNEALINMNTVQMFRLASRADVKRNNTKYAVDRAGANVAEFQSINMLGSQDGGANAAGFDFWSAGGVAAIERDFSKNLFAGLSLGGTYNKVDGDANADANSTNFIVNVYGEYSFDQIPLDLFLNLGYSHGWNETSRQTALGTAKADYDSNSFYSLGGVAYTFSDVATKGLSIKPMLMYNLAYSNADSVDEEGAGIYNASVEGNDFLNFRTMLGVEVKYDITSNFSALVRAFWTHEFADNSYDVDYRIAQAASYMPTAKFESEEVGRDAAVLGFGLQYKFDDAVSAFIDYSATLRSGYSAHGLNLGAQFRF